MPASVLYMSMSLDGYIAGPDDDHENALGVDGHHLHDWLSEGEKDVPVHGRVRRSSRSPPASSTRWRFT